VPGGVATIYAIKTAGLAIGIGVGSSFIVLVSFYWGIFVFGEHVHSRFQACFAVGCMLCGLVGMAYYSAPTVAHAATASHAGNNVEENDDDDDHPHQEDGLLRGLLPDRLRRHHLRAVSSSYDPVRSEDPDFIPPEMDEDEYVSFQDLTSAGRATTSSFADHGSGMSSTTTNYVAMNDRHGSNDDDVVEHSTLPDSTHSQETSEFDDERDMVVVDRVDRPLSITEEEEQDESSSQVLCCFGRLSIQRRTLGILVAVFSGVYGGSIMAPLKFAPPDCKGLGYLISFAVGASIVNLTLWIVRFLYLCLRRYNGSFRDAYRALPSFHFRKMWLYGGACGLIWSTGMFLVVTLC
jgi:hypothetical protein